jgi:DNA-binding LytR/AlgR family response regulator
MISIAICDDDKKICSQIEDIIVAYSKKRQLKIDLSVFYGSKSLLKFLNNGNSFDLIYLDIELKNIDGVEIGRHIRKTLKCFHTEIVYISGDCYSSHLFNIPPLNFMPKPINPSIVIDDIEFALERVKSVGGCFKYQKGYDIYSIPINEILYFESQNRKIKIVSVHQVDFFYGKLSDVVFSVSKYQFIHIHRSYLINSIHVSIVRYNEVVLSNGITLPISRSKRINLRDYQFNE